MEKYGTYIWEYVLFHPLDMPVDIDCTFSFKNHRFGKHRKDERLGEKMDRKGSSKWRPEETQVSEEETMKMRMEQER